MNQETGSSSTSVERNDSGTMSGADSSSDSHTKSLRSLSSSIVGALRLRRRFLIFPAVVLFLLALFTALGVSGSSTPLLSPNGGGEDSVIIGSPRSIRSDEWIVHTPFVISQVENDFPRYGDVGVGSHDMSILSDLPVLDWTSVFHPNLWAYYVLPINNAHAFDWWSVSAILLIGTYFFLLVLVRSLLWSILGAVFLYGSPFFHWWYTSMAFTSIGWLALASACLLTAVKISTWHRVVFALLGSYFIVCFALVIYPPWQIATAIAVAAITLGALWSRWREDLIPPRRIASTLAITGSAAIVPLLIFFVSRRPAFQAIAQTVYPGERVVAGGDLPWTQLFSGWFGLNYVTNGPGIRGVLFPNESEASSFLFLGIGLLVALPIVWRFLVPLGDRLRPVAIATVAVMVLFLTQMLVGLPSIVAKITLLSTVPERRTLVGLGFASLVLVVLVGSSLERLDLPRRARFFGGVALVGAMAVGVLGLSDNFRSVNAAVGTRLTVLAVFAALVPSALFFWRPRLAVALLAVFGLSISLSVNPLIRGLSQTRDSTLVNDIHKIESADEADGAWIGETYWIASLLTTAGVRNLSGVNLYPNVPAWEILDPDRNYEDVWNRYAQAIWSFDTESSSLSIRLVQMDMIEVRVNPCDPALDRFMVRHVVTPRKLTAACLLEPIQSVGPEGEQVFLYERLPVGVGPKDGWLVR